MEEFQRTMEKLEFEDLGRELREGGSFTLTGHWGHTGIGQVCSK